MTKDVLAAGSTRWAQGGIAAALGAGDSPEEHYRDTIVAGAGVCDDAAVRVLVREGPAAVRELVQIGARFDRAGDGELSLTREGGHHRDRIAHAGGDATGAEIQRALVTRTLDATAISVIEHALVLDLLLADTGAVAGLTLHVLGEGQRDGVGAVRARAVVLATGGHRPGVRVDDQPERVDRRRRGRGPARRRGGARPRVRAVPSDRHLARAATRAASSRSSARRCAARARSWSTTPATRFMTGQHELADLAPRDIVAKAILRRMRETGAEHMWLDARHFGAEKWRVRFPTIHETLLSLGIDPVRELIPVVPACHYASGGVRTDLRGRVVGARPVRVRRDGLHRRARRQPARVQLAARGAGVRPAHRRGGRGAARRAGPAAGRPRRRAGGRRAARRGRRGRSCSSSCRATSACCATATGLTAAGAGLAKLAAADGGEPGTEAWETTNLLTVASALVQAALRREETRGAHWRDDFPDRDDAHWRGHLDTVASPRTDR